jgi:hypothetical protein
LYHPKLKERSKQIKEGEEVQINLDLFNYRVGNQKWQYFLADLGEINFDPTKITLVSF